MNDGLLRDVLFALDEFDFKVRGAWLRNGKCPECGKRELWTHAQTPWVLKCDRQNKCGFEQHVKDRDPDLFDNWSKRTKDQLPTNPNATADAYLSLARGLDVTRMRGWYTQGHYFSKELNAGTATVRFAVGEDGYWERLIDQPWRFGKRKASVKYGFSFKGLWWAPPDMDLAAVRCLWLVEGIFDAISLWQNGVPAAALISASNYPSLGLEQLRRVHDANGTDCSLVWAQDTDEAGMSAIPKCVAHARKAGWECHAAQVPQHGKTRLDWNDLHLRGRLSVEDQSVYLHLGALLIAASPTEKALLIYRRDGRKAEFGFDFDSQLYWFKLDVDRYGKAVQKLKDEGRDGDGPDAVRDIALRESHTVRRIASCSPKPLYYQANLLTDESWYYFRVTFPHIGKPIKGTFSAAALASSSEFKKRLLSIAPGAVYSGSSSMLERMMEEQLFNIHRVQTVDFVGYSREHECYLLGRVAVRKGLTYELNNEDYFDLGSISLKSLNQSVTLNVSTDRDAYRAEWLALLWQCFGAKGIVALTFWLGAFFAEQIRATQKSFPFLEVVGEAGAGKSTLIEFLWKLLGRADYEGFDPSKSSLAARARNFAQVSNLPVVLIESDRERSGDKGPHVKSFDWDELKTAFNGRSVRARGVATSGNETYEPPFRGAIVISQNHEVVSSEAILQRIVQLKFAREGQTPDTRAAALALEQMPVEAVSGFALRCAKAEQAIVKVLDERTPVHEAQLLAHSGIKTTRIAKNHAQMLALLDALVHVVQLSDEQVKAVQSELRSMAEQRQAAINLDVPLVTDFWEIFDFLNDGSYPLNHSRTPDELLAVNLNHFVQACRERGQTPPDMAGLKKALRGSKRHRFLDCRVVNSALKAECQINASTAIWCWVFERGAQRTSGPARPSGRSVREPRTRQHQEDREDAAID